MLARQGFHHRRGEGITAQGQLPFQYEEERRESGMTALAGLPVHLDLAQVVGSCKGMAKRRWLLAVPAGTPKWKPLSSR